MSFTSAGQASRWGDVYVASAARGISGCGDFLAATALALALQTKGAGSLAVAAVMIASTVPLVVVAPLGGRLADRMDSRRLLVVTGAAQTVVCAILAYTEHPAAMVALVALLATGFAITQPTLAALIPEMVDRDNLPKATAIAQTAGSLGFLVGPALAGVLVGEFGLRVPLLVNAGTYLAIVGAGLFLRTRRGGRTAAEPAAADGVAPAAWSLGSDSLLFALVVAFAVAIGSLSAVNVAEVFFTREVLHASETAYGLLMALWAASMVAGAALTARTLRTATDSGVAAGVLVLLVGTATVLLLAAAVQHLLWLVPLWIVGGIINGGENVSANVIVARRVPSAVRGRAMGTFVGMINAANVIGFLLGGVLLTLMAPRPLILACGIAALLAVAACTPSVRRAIRRERAATVTPEPPAGQVALAAGYRSEA